MSQSYSDILVAVRRKLLASPHFSPLVGVDVGVDTIDLTRYDGAFNDAWVFRGVEDTSKPMRDPSATGMATVSFDLRQPWSVPNNHNTLRFRTLRFVILADQTRIVGDNSLIGTRDAEDRCDRIGKAITAEFNDPANRNHNWPNNVYVVRCDLFGDLIISDVPNLDGLVSGDLRFSLHLP